jgi:5-methylcytosine-specific restriction endonuclease McrA
MRKGQHHLNESKRKMSIKRRLKIMPYETRQKISKSLKGLVRGPMSEEHKQKLSEAIRINLPTKNILLQRGFSMSGRKHSEESKRKIGMANSIALKGRHLSEEHRRKLSLARKNHPSGMLGKHHSEAWKLKMSQMKKGKKVSEETKYKMYLAQNNEEHRRHLSEVHRGPLCHLWRGGISFLPYTVEFTRLLKNTIRSRDEFTCQICGKKNILYGLSVHHIDYDKHNCSSNNLISLCKKCHAKTNIERPFWKDFLSVRTGNLIHLNNDVI